MLRGLAEPLLQVVHRHTGRLFGGLNVAAPLVDLVDQVTTQVVRTGMKGLPWKTVRRHAKACLPCLRTVEM